MRAVWFVAALAGAIGSTACGSDDSSCEQPALDGSPFGAEGTGTLTGTGTLPEGVPEGFQLQVTLRQGGASIGVLPEDFFSEKNLVCGKTFLYTVRRIEAGTYRLGFLAFDPNDDGNEVEAEFEGEGPSDFTIADGQTLTQDTVFQLVQ